MGVTSCATLPFLPGTHVFSTVFKLLQANSTLFKHLWLVTLVNLPALTEEQQESLDEDESILLDSPIPDAELDTLESCIRLCGEGIDILDARCLYAVACNKHTRDMYEANIGAVLRHLLDSHHHPGKEDFA